MRRISAVAASIAVLLASGCLGSSTAHAPRDVSTSARRTIPSTPSDGHAYATFRLRGSYACTPRGDQFAQVCGRRFTLTCRSPQSYAEMFGSPPEEPVCLAIIDYRTQVRLLGGPECNCPPSLLWVNVDGSVAGKRIRERVTTCSCGLDSRARDDARVILHWQPPRLLVGGFGAASGGSQ